MTQTRNMKILILNGSPRSNGLISRILDTMANEAVIVSTGSTPWPFNIWFNQTRGTVKALREILKWSGFSVQGVLQKGGTKQHHELTMKELQKCKTLIKRLTI